MHARWVARFPQAGTAFTQLQGRRLDPDASLDSEVRPVQSPAQGFVMQSPHGGLDGGGLFQYSGLATVNARMNISTLVFCAFF